MIYFRPHSGLGNTLFQIATLWTLAKDNDDELCLLDVDKIIVALTAIGRGNLDFLLKRFPNFNGEPNNLIKRYPIHHVPLEYEKEYQYQGYFPCEKYFKDRRKEILELFKHPNEFENKINEYSHLFNNISLHVRRGDYVLNSQLFSNATMDYYNKALSLLPQDMQVLIFSDDLAWCKQNFIGERFVFIDEIDYIALYLMSKMKYHINANSSFSWWGAWLSESDHVVVPKEWFSKGMDLMYNDKDIYPDSWIKI
jgi:hypothetical protein